MSFSSRSGLPEQKPLSTYKRLLEFARPYAGRLVLGVFFGLIFGSSTGAILGALKETVSTIFDPSEVSLRLLIATAALLPAFTALRGVGDYFSRYFVEWVGNRVVMDLRSRVFGHIHNLSLLYFSSSRTGELISRTTSDTMMVQRAVSTVFGDLAREPFVLIAAVGYLFYLDWKLAFASLVVFPICIIPVALFGRKVRHSAREGQEKMADVISILQESIAGVRIVKAFGMESYEKDRFDRTNRSVFGRLMKVARAQASVEPVIVTISVVGLSMVLLYTRWVGMDSGEFFAFAAALVLMYQPVKKLSRIHLHIQQSCAAADRIFEVLDTEITVKETENPIALQPPVHSIDFKDVSFSYEDQPVLQNISFRVKSGECIAFVGSSGAGKTTLVSLVPRFYDVTEGRIEINACDLREYSLASLRKQIGMVTQDTILFNDTVAANIAYGRQDASKEEIEDAARRAHAHAFIVQLENGYETIIGERGTRLSGGQCQRLSIARAILRNPPIMILDEATSALDTESERQVQAALDELMEDRTVLVIAHRLSTIMKADRILVLDKGKIAEEGRHEELLAKNGLYKYLYDLQFDAL